MLRALSCLGEPRFEEALLALKPASVIVAGIESHVCVYQTVAHLLLRGYHVEVVADAVSSRTQFNRDMGLRKMEAQGAKLTTVEMVLFELLEVAKGEQFKQIQQLVK